MTSRQITRTSIRRIAATAALSLVGIGLSAGVAAADQFQNDDLDIVEAPTCSPFDAGSFSVVMLLNGQGQRDIWLSYSDGVLTCDTPVSVRVYGLPNAEASIDHPDVTLISDHSMSLSMVEFSTVDLGTPLKAGTVPGVSCSAVRVAVGGMVFPILKHVNGCGHIEPEHPGDLVNPDPVDPEPEHPGDLVNPDPVDPEPEHPGDLVNPDPVDPELSGDDGNAEGSGDDVEPVEPEQIPEAGVPGGFSTTSGVAPEAGSDEEITMLPSTGSSTTVMAALAAMLVALGGAGMHIARREVI